METYIRRIVPQQAGRNGTRKIFKKWIGLEVFTKTITSLSFFNITKHYAYIKKKTTRKITHSTLPQK